jgi:hypothetical protein
MYLSRLCFSGLNIYKLFDVAEIKTIPYLDDKHKQKYTICTRFNKVLGDTNIKLNLSIDSIRIIASRRELHYNEIFYLVRHGGGGFTESDVYKMPIMRRKKYVKKLSNEIKEENERQKALSEGKKASSNGVSFSMDDLLKGKDKDAFKADYKAPPIKKRETSAPK